MRITMEDIEGTFDTLVTEMGGKLAENSDDSGAYKISSQSPGDGVKRFKIERITSSNSGVTTIMQAQGIRDFYNRMWSAIKILREVEYNLKYGDDN